MNLKIIQNGDESHRLSLGNINYSSLRHGGIIVLVQGDYSRKKEMLSQIIFDYIASAMSTYVSNEKNFYWSNNIQFPKYIIDNSLKTNIKPRLILCHDNFFHRYSHKIKHHRQIIKLLQNPTKHKIILVIVTEKIQDLPQIPLDVIITF